MNSSVQIPFERLCETYAPSTFVKPSREPINPVVYMLRLKTGKHYYIGATTRLKERLFKHATYTICQDGSSFPTKTYGFSGHPQNILALYPCTTYQDALLLEKQLVSMYHALCPDTPVYGGGSKLGYLHHN